MGHAAGPSPTASVMSDKEIPPFTKPSHDCAGFRSRANARLGEPSACARYRALTTEGESVVEVRSITI